MGLQVACHRHSDGQRHAANLTVSIAVSSLRPWQNDKSRQTVFALLLPAFNFFDFWCWFSLPLLRAARMVLVLPFGVNCLLAISMARVGTRNRIGLDPEAPRPCLPVSLCFVEQITVSPCHVSPTLSLWAAILCWRTASCYLPLRGDTAWKTHPPPRRERFVHTHHKWPAPRTRSISSAITAQS